MLLRGVTLGHRITGHAVKLAKLVDLPTSRGKIHNAMSVSLEAFSPTSEAFKRIMKMAPVSNSTLWAIIGGIGECCTPPT